MKNVMLKKVIVIVVSIILIIGIAAGTSILTNKKSVPAMTTVENGLSAYELAVQYGYEGTVQEWLDSLNGKSAYEIAKENGYSGSESDWTASLKATAGKNGVGIKTAAFSNSNELLITLTDGTVLNLGVAKGVDGKDGENGTNGTDGQNGADGKDGKDGVGITSANINTEGQLVITFSDGKTVNLDKVVGMNGQNGVGITTSEINNNGELVITYTNGQTANLGVVIGAKGDKGDTGANGQNGSNGSDGVSIVNSVINSKGELVLTYSDSTVKNLGNVVGSNGTNGINGTDGKNGVSVTTASINSVGELVLEFSNGQVSNVGKVIGADGTNGTNGTNGINGLTPFINTNGNWQIGDTDTGVKAAGTDGTNGTNGANGTNGINGKTPFINDAGNWQIGDTDTGVKAAGTNGINGTNGKTPFINTAGNWQIGDTDTGVKASGSDGTNGVNGLTPFIHTNGNWWIGETDTGIKATGLGVKKSEIIDGKLIITYTDNTVDNLGSIIGEKGEKGDKGDTGDDGLTPFINATGNWQIGDTDTGVKAAGTDGTNGQNGIKGDKGDKGDNGIDGLTPYINTNGNWQIGETDTGIKAAGTNGINGTNGVGIEKIEILNGELNITLNNGALIELGSIKGTDGKDGAKGDKGDKGETGAAGKDGKGIGSVDIVNGELIITYTDGDTKNLGSIKGPKGDKGDQGLQGETGPQGPQGPAGSQGEQGVSLKEAKILDDGNLKLTFSDNSTKIIGVVVGKDGETGNGITSIEKTATNDLIDTYTIRYTDNTTSTFTVTNGKNGIQGVKGETGADGHTPVITIVEGYWYIDGVNTNVRAQGLQGETGNGIALIEKTNTDDLKDTYTITYTDGSTSKFIVTNGKDGSQGIQGVKGEDGHTPVITIVEGYWYVDGINTNVRAEGLKGDKGDKGDTGEKGETGATGADGVGVSSATINNNGKLIITLSDESIIEVGPIVGPKGDTGEKGETGATGADGVGIDELKIENGNLKVKYTNDNTFKDLGNIKGADGVGIAEIYVENGYLYVRKTNEDTATQLAYIKGDKGDTGPQGPKGDAGEQGPSGKDGVDGKSAYELYKQAYPEYTGTYTEWLASLKGEKGDTGRGIKETKIVDGVLIITYTDNTTDELIITDPNEGILAFTLLADGTYSVSAGPNIGETDTIVIPATYRGKNVTVINSKAFQDNEFIKSVTLPDTLKSIHKHAFYNCTSLTTISIPKSVTNIAHGAFLSSGLKTATLEDPTGWTSVNVSDTDGLAHTWWEDRLPTLTASSYSDPTKFANALKATYDYNGKILCYDFSKEG